MDVLELDFERAKAKHLLFKTNLRSFLYGIPIDESTLVGYEECAFGRWIYDHALISYGHIAEVHALEKIHQQLHRYAF